MNSKTKRRLKFNLVTLFLITVSFISLTLAWFAYSGVVSSKIDVDVKSWYIEIEKDGQAVTRDIVISLDEIYPGMDNVDEVLKIKNLGDSDAEVNYKIVSARILGDDEHNYNMEEIEYNSSYVEDMLSHGFPFNINLSLTKKYALAQGDESIFEVSVSWPLDSGNDQYDSEWGTKAYNFQNAEKMKYDLDSNYQVRPSIQIVISVEAEQYMETNTSSDFRYDLGDELLFDVATKKACTTMSSTCLKTYVIDVNNTIGNNSITLLPNPYSNYLNGTYSEYNRLFSEITNNWQATTRPLLVEDLMRIVSTDVSNSFLVRNNLSNAIIGNLNSSERMRLELDKAINYNGYYEFINERFGFLSSVDCYWFQNEYNTNKAFSIQKIDDIISRIYGNDKASTCKVIPVIVALKQDLY